MVTVWGASHSLYKWMKTYAQAASHAASEDHEAENRRLKRALARLTREGDILKKGETIFRHQSEDNRRTRTSPRM